MCMCAGVSMQYTAQAQTLTQTLFCDAAVPWPACASDGGGVALTVPLQRAAALAAARAHGHLHSQTFGIITRSSIPCGLRMLPSSR